MDVREQTDPKPFHVTNLLCHKDVITSVDHERKGAEDSAVTGHGAYAASAVPA